MRKSRLQHPMIVQYLLIAGCDVYVYNNEKKTNLREEQSRQDKTRYSTQQSTQLIIPPPFIPLNRSTIKEPQRNAQKCPGSALIIL